MLGTRRFNKVQIDCHQGDLTQFACDVMINAANEALRGGGGVDGAIHSAGGPTILEECRLLGRCPTGEARMTRAGTLPARWVVHAVGPVWQGGDAGEGAVLASTYRAALTLAAESGCRHIASPAISAGAYGFPPHVAARVAMASVREFLGGERHSLGRITFVLYTAPLYQGFRQALAEVFPEASSPEASSYDG